MHRVTRFGLVLSQAEKAAVQRLAEAEGGLSQAALVRRLIRLEAIRRNLWPVSLEEQTEEVREHAAQT